MRTIEAETRLVKSLQEIVQFCIANCLPYPANDKRKLRKSGKDNPILGVYVSGLLHRLLRLHGKCFRRAFQAVS